MDTSDRQDTQCDQDEAMIRQARGKFLAMAGTYSLGALNDNFFKQALMLLAVLAGKADIQGWATVIFTAPYILFAAHAGWLADRFPKRNIVIAAKSLELLAMIFGAAGLLMGSWTFAMIMLGIMGLQAAIFSPALNGSIPELYPAYYVTKANSVLKMGVTAAILIGIACAGMALDAPGPDICGVSFGKVVVAGVVVTVAAIGLGLSFGVVRRSAADRSAPFPWLGSLISLRHLWHIRRDRLLATTIVLDSYVWFAGALQILLINVMGLEQLHLASWQTSGLAGMEMIGIAVGGLLAGRFVARPEWFKFMAPITIALGCAMILVGIVPFIPPAIATAGLMTLLGLSGVAGGLLLVPLESFIQVRPAAAEKGAIIAAANLAAFSAILLSGPVSNMLRRTVGPGGGFVALGAVTVAMALFAWLAFPRDVQC